MGKQSNRVPAYGGDNPYIFISYSHKDTAKVLPVIAAMQDKGYRIWYDQGIEAGSEWSNNIAKHLRDCSAFVAFVSKHSMASENCLDEIAYAKSNNKPSLMIFLEEEVELPAGVEMQTARFQRMFYTEDTDIAGFVGQVEGARMLSACRGDDAYEYYNSVREGAAHGNNVGGGSKVRKLRAAMIVGGAVVVILFVVFAIFMMSQSSSQNEDMTSEHTDTETTESENTNESENTTAEDTQEETSEETSVETEPEETEPEETETQKPEIVMSDDLADLTFMLCGEVYQLPMSYSELEANGWQVVAGAGEAHADMLLFSHVSASVRMVQGIQEIKVTVYNPSENSRAVKDCIMTSIYVEESGYADFSIAKGISIGASEEDVVNAFGEPVDVNFYATKVCGYLHKDYDKSRVSFYYAEGKCTAIAYYADVPEHESTETNLTVPPCVSEYLAPSELGNDILSGRFQLFDGMIGNLPVPLATFLDNGWETDADLSNSLATGRHTRFAIQKNGVTFDVTVMNLGEWKTVLSNCMVTGIWIETDGKDEPSVITLPGGICTGGTYDELSSKLPTERFRTYETDTRLVYIHNPSSTDLAAKVGTVEFKFDKTNGEKPCCYVYIECDTIR